MANKKNEHISPRKGGWVVRHEGSEKISRLFENKKDATEYASIIALTDGGSVVTHKYNGQFKSFKPGDEIQIRTHKIASIITGTNEQMHPIVNNTQTPLIEEITLA